ncbi:MAG: saccharopine dehydrogenase NADP-binding domain-containing protein [Bacteroidetes bacterium]|nr:saccharopine dehydrogenase NADP-binding domain-containing protein [Bacteroidota bacterium]
MQTTHSTQLVGILTHPVGENLIHQMFSAACAISGADIAPLIVDAPVRDVATPYGALRTLGASGVYLDGRLRSSAMGLVDYLSDEAHGANVINAITFDDDHATGHNTEARAVIAQLEPYKDSFAHGSAVILGGGAMARSAAFAVVRHFRVKHVTIANRTPQQAQVLKQLLSGTKTSTVIEAQELFPPDIAQLLAEARLIVNATPLGSYPNVDETPITIPDIFHNRQIVLDTNFSPAITRFLRDASTAGATTISGVEVLLAQVQEAYELLTRSEFPQEEIRTLLETNERE